MRERHLLGLRKEGLNPQHAAQVMAEHRVYVSIRGDSIRVSPHLYFQEADLGRLDQALAALAQSYEA